LTIRRDAHAQTVTHSIGDCFVVCQVVLQKLESTLIGHLAAQLLPQVAGLVQVIQQQVMIRDHLSFGCLCLFL